METPAPVSVGVVGTPASVAPLPKVRPKVSNPRSTVSSDVRQREEPEAARQVARGFGDGQPRAGDEVVDARPTPTIHAGST